MVEAGEDGGDDEDGEVVAGTGTEAGAATPPTGPSPQPASTRKGIAHNAASILRRIFPPAA
ncbi:hypothetical protein GCM10027258_56510 [Amycolatopsis stemonae]